MTTTTIKVFTCDRCGEEARLDSNASPAGWGRIAAQQTDGRGRIGHANDSADDLCGACLAGLFAWFNDTTKLRAPPPPPPTRVQFGGEALRVAETRAAAVIEDQLKTAIAALQEQPTGALTGEWPDAARAGLEERAKALVASFLDQLKIKRPRRAKGVG